MNIPARCLNLIDRALDRCPEVRGRLLEKPASVNESSPCGPEKKGVNICKTDMSKYVERGRAIVRLPMGFLTPTSLAHAPFHFFCAHAVRRPDRAGGEPQEAVEKVRNSLQSARPETSPYQEHRILLGGANPLGKPESFFNSRVRACSVEGGWPQPTVAPA